jgi:hypothetical protein
MTRKQGHRRLVSISLAVVTCLCGCRKSNSGNAIPAGDAKAQIQAFLAQKTGQKQFTPAIDLELPKQVATLQSNALELEQRVAAIRAKLREPNTNTAPGRATLEQELQVAEASLQSTRGEIQKKSEELDHQEDNYIRAVREQMRAPGSYAELYRIIGQQLATADRLLADPNSVRRRMGLKLAREACGHAMADSTDVWLAARICEAYVWPNVDLLDTKPGSHERAIELLQTSRRVFFSTDETNSVLTNYYLLLARAPDRHAADTFRVELADWLEEKGDVKSAHTVLAEIQDSQVLASANERITRVKQRAAGAP